MKIGVVGMLGAVALTLAGCGQEEGVYSQSPEELREIFATAKTEYQSSAEAFKQTIVGNGIKGDKVEISLYADNDSLTTRTCLLSFEPVEGGTRAVPDCSGISDITAGGRTLNAFNAAEVLEHVDATLENRPYDWSKMRSKKGGLAMKNMKAMRQEALEAHDRQNWEAGDDARIQAWVDETVGAEMERIELEEAGW